jgi:hypothetical protein
MGKRRSGMVGEGEGAGILKSGLSVLCLYARHSSIK